MRTDSAGSEGTRRTGKPYHLAPRVALRRPERTHDIEHPAEQWLEDTGSLKDVPESLRNYIDFESWADDAEVNGDIFTVEDGGEVHVFWGA